MAILAAGIIAMLGLINWIRFPDFRYPALLHAMIWGLICFFLSFRWQILNSPSHKFYELIVLSVIMFSIGAWMAARNILPIKGIRNIKRQSLPPKKFINTLVVIVLIGIPFWIRRAIELAQYGPFDNFLRNVRISRAIIFVDGEGSLGGFYYGILSYIFPISIFVAVSALIYHFAYRKNPIIVTLGIILPIPLGVLSTGRTNLILLLTTIVGTLFVLRRMHPLKAIAIYLLIGMILFVSIGIVMHKAGVLGQPPIVILSEATTSFISYALGPSVALDQLLNSEDELSWGRHTFRFYYRVKELIGYKTDVTSLVREIAYVPFPINAYTVADPYFRDYGIIGVIVAQFILGIIHGFIYKKATAAVTSASSVMLYSLSLYPLLFQFFQDQYLSIISIWLQFAFLIILSAFLRRLHTATTQRN